MGLRYGEGAEAAKQRLVKKISKRDEGDAKSVRQVVEWLSPPDPWSNHASARQRHQAGTGQWLLASSEYCAWKRGAHRHLWLLGKAGSGKTILFSTIVEDVKNHCMAVPDTAYAVFYFSFSDKSKQEYSDVLHSLVAQLASHGPTVSALVQASSRGAPRQDELESALVTMIDQHDQVYLLFDALDESPEEQKTRQHVLDKVAWLLHKTANSKLLATSRPEHDIQAFIEDQQFVSVSLKTKLVDTDIKSYVSNELLAHPRLRSMTWSVKQKIEHRLTEKSDGM